MVLANNENISSCRSYATEHLKYPVNREVLLKAPSNSEVGLRLLLPGAFRRGLLAVMTQALRTAREGQGQPVHFRRPALAVSHVSLPSYAKRAGVGRAALAQIPKPRFQVTRRQKSETTTSYISSRRVCFGADANDMVPPTPGPSGRPRFDRHAATSAARRKTGRAPRVVESTAKTSKESPRKGCTNQHLIRPLKARLREAAAPSSNTASDIAYDGD
ncbi:hypothetical protein MRX96_006674 [Rhipicephalus microplus]